ncbi:MAG: AraC family transcriptional regulator [Chthonomonadaceae bacterium]|nr:AraC family transcriptional regulator [Chthonomonadaceae bacterium]
MLSRIHLAKNIDVSLVNVMRTDAFTDGYVHRWTIPETTIAQVIAGRYEIEHAGGHLFIEPGEMYIVQANTTVAITHHFAESGRMEAQWVRFNAMLYRTCDVISLLEVPLKIDAASGQCMGDFISGLWSLAGRGGIGSAEEIPGFLADAYRIPILLMQLVQAIIGLSTPSPEALALLDHADRLAPVLEFIHQNLAKGGIAVEDLAKISCLSLSHFHALFRRAFGQTPVQYIRGMRIREACRLLINTQQKIHQIAEATGFGNAYYFCRVFKTLHGVSPGEYRKANSLLRYPHSEYAP